MTRYLSRFFSLLLITMVISGCSSELPHKVHQPNKIDQSMGGDGVGNGGDGVILEFREYAEKALILARNHNQAIELVSDDLFDTLITQTLVQAKISSTQDRLLGRDRLEKDALNYPEDQRIIVNRQRWKNLPAESKLVLSLHELLGLLYVDDSDYLLSSALLSYDPVTKEGILPKVDILFVIDDSGSMARHQMNLADNVQVLLDRIRKRRINYQIGAITTSVYDDAYRSIGGQLVGTPSYITLATTGGLNALKENILNLGTNGRPEETPFKAIHLSFIERLNDPANQGFYRHDADLEIVIMTDSYNKETIDSITLAAELIKFKGDKNDIAISAFLAMDNPYCNTDSGYSNKYEPLFDIFGGSLFNLCRKDYSTDLSELGVQISERAIYRHRN